MEREPFIVVVVVASSNIITHFNLKLIFRFDSNSKRFTASEDSPFGCEPIALLLRSVWAHLLKIFFQHTVTKNTAVQFVSQNNNVLGAVWTREDEFHFYSSEKSIKRVRKRCCVGEGAATPTPFFTTTTTSGTREGVSLLVPPNDERHDDSDHDEGDEPFRNRRRAETEIFDDFFLFLLRRTAGGGNRATKIHFFTVSDNEHVLYFLVKIFYFCARCTAGNK